MEQLENCWTGFQEICYLTVVHRFIFQLKRTSLTAALHEDLNAFPCVSRNIFTGEKIELKKNETHFMSTAFSL